MTKKEPFRRQISSYDLQVLWYALKHSEYGRPLDHNGWRFMGLGPEERYASSLGILLLEGAISAIKVHSVDHDQEPPAIVSTDTWSAKRLTKANAGQIFFQSVLNFLQKEPAQTDEESQIGRSYEAVLDNKKASEMLVSWIQDLPSTQVEQIEKLEVSLAKAHKLLKEAFKQYSGPIYQFAHIQDTGLILAFIYLDQFAAIEKLTITASGPDAVSIRLTLPPSSPLHAYLDNAQQISLHTWLKQLRGKAQESVVLNNNVLEFKERTLHLRKGIPKTLIYYFRDNHCNAIPLQKLYSICEARDLPRMRKALDNFNGRVIRTLEYPDQFLIIRGDSVEVKNKDLIF